MTTLVALTGVFTLAEYALIIARRWRLENLAATDRRAAVALRLLDGPLRFIGTNPRPPQPGDRQRGRTGSGSLGIGAGKLVGARRGGRSCTACCYSPLATGVASAVGIGAITFLSVRLDDLVHRWLGKAPSG